MIMSGIERSKSGRGLLGVRGFAVRASRAVAMGVVVVVLGPVAQPALAAQINYGTHAGTHINYVNVTEDTGASEPLPLLGAPSVTGNSMDFNPVGFDAATSG